MGKTIKAAVFILTAIGLTACNAAGTKPDAAAPGMAEATAGATAGTTAAENSETSAQAKPQSNNSKMAAANTPVDKLELIGNRMTAVQDHLLQIKSQAGQLQQQNQALSLQLQSLKTELQVLAAVEPQQNQEAPQPDTFNGVLDQITMMANELSSQVQDGAFRVVSAYTAKGQWVLIRFHRFTGETWLADKGQWNLLDESGETGTAEYEVVLLRADKDIKGYVAARINRISGESWWLKQNIWQPYLQ